MSLSEYILERLNKKEEEQHIEGMSILDAAMNANNDKKEDELIEKLNKVIKNNGPTIYAFVVDKVKNAIKVGYTDQHPEKRIQQWKDVYEPHGMKVMPIGFWSADEFNAAGERVFFWDHAVHEKITGRGFKNVNEETFYKNFSYMTKDELATVHYSKEFFDEYKRLLNGELSFDEREKLSDKLIEDIIKQMKLNIKNGTQDFRIFSYETKQEASKEWGSPQTYNNTDLQEEAINNGVAAIKKDAKNILMAAVMRFGKTHAAYEIVKKAKLKRVIVTSAKADVRAAWRDDINHKHFYKDFVFIEVLNQYKWDVTAYDEKSGKLMTHHLQVHKDMLNEYADKTIIFFFTLHDLGGNVKQMKAKHIGLFDEEFDMLIVDETHYGSHANTFGKVTGLGIELEDEVTDIDDELKEMENDRKTLESLKRGLRYKRVLQVSGTPYYILASNEMIEPGSEIISKVSYTDMLEARDKWNRDNEKKGNKKEKPWTSPYYGIPTLRKIGLKLNKECRTKLKDIGAGTDVGALFKTVKGDFLYKPEVESLMKSLFGRGNDDKLAFLNNKKVEGSKTCKHTLIVLPRIAACNAMEKLLSSFIDTDERKIFNIVGGNKISSGELNDELFKLDDKGKKSIILTVNRFLTGVSLPVVDSMIYLKDSHSPQEYDQNIFRLCTRYVKKVKDAKGGEPKYVNMKDNVYLIDFNIANMFTMLNNSARMKAAAEGNPTTERIKELMDQDLKTVPVFAEDAARNEILGKMESITTSDLMKFYTGYNAKKSISEIANDDVEMFMKLFTNKRFQNTLNSVNVGLDKSKNTVEDPNNIGTEEIESGTAKSSEKTELEPLPKNVKRKLSKEEQKNICEAKEKFKTIIKTLLYWNLCQDHPYQEMKDIMNAAKENEEIKNSFKAFKIKYEDLVKVYEELPTRYKQAFNDIISKINILHDDTSRKSIDKFVDAVSDLGKIARNEVITPEPVVEKMINKLKKEDFEKAETILLVNEKYGEFFKYIAEHFGKTIAKKCRIVPSSEIGVMLTKKLLNSFGLNNYINTIILDIGDVNDDGEYNVKDFLELMKNKEELKKKTGVKHFDICLMNPPYSGGTRKGDGLYVDFINKCIDISYNVISVNPFDQINTHVENGALKNKAKLLHDNIDNFKPEIEIIDSSGFDASFKGEVCIVSFLQNKNDKITIKKNSKIHLFNSQSEIIINDNEYLKEFKKKLFEFMIGKDVDKFINLKHPKIYIGSDKNNEIKFIKDNVYNHLNYTKISAPYAKFTCKIEKNIDKDKLYIFLMKPDASFAYYTYKQTSKQGIPYEESWFEKRLCYIKCDSLKESKNICEYLNTDFCSLILKLQIYFHSYLKYDFVPWLDFSKSYTDEELFNMFGIKYNKSEINKILNK